MAAPRAVDSEPWDDLVDRLAVYDVWYLTGGSAWDGRRSPYRTRSDAPIGRLIADLSHAPQARLRNALAALLLRHPEHAPAALEVADALPPTDRARLIILTSYLAAAALQRRWRFTLNIYLPGHTSIDADGIADKLGVPHPDEDYGRPCLHGAARLLARDQPFPFDYAREWEDTAELVLADFRAQERLRPAEESHSYHRTAVFALQV